MEPLILRHRSQKITKLIIGIVFIAAGIVQIWFDTGEREIKEWVISALLVIMGIVNLTPLSGSDKSCIIPDGEGCRFRLRNQIRWRTVQSSEIEKIIFGKLQILIALRGKEPVKVYLGYLDKDHKIKVYDFFVEYARQKNLIVERQGQA